MMQVLWQELGYQTPSYSNDRARKAFEFLLPLVMTATEKPSLEPERDHDGTKKGLRRDHDGIMLELSGDQVMILQACVTPKSISELMSVLHRTNRTKFRETNISPLLTSGLLVMTIPTAPRSKHQQYRTTEAGKAIISDQELR